MTITKYKQMLWKTNFYAAISIKKFGFTICLDFSRNTKVRIFAGNTSASSVSLSEMPCTR